MDVILKTNDPDRQLALMQVSRFADDSGFCCELVVRSHGFGASVQFCFEPRALRAFHEAVVRMNRTLTGTAKLKPAYDEPFVSLELLRTGAVMVSGQLSRLEDDTTHVLHFGFRTDQTCLGPFARDLGACFQLAAV
jgi:hypothetical protein